MTTYMRLKLFPIFAFCIAVPLGFLHSQDDSATDVDGIETEIEWRTELGDWVLSHPVVHRERVYVVASAFRRGLRREISLNCIEAATGKILWKWECQEFEMLWDENFYGVLTAGSPLFDDRRMYFVAPDMTLVCIDLENSDSVPEIVYEKNLKPIFAEIADFTGVPVLATPVLVGDNIILSLQVNTAANRNQPHRPNLVTKIAGFSKHTGDEIWQFTTSTNGTRFQYASPVIYNGSNEYSLVSVDPNGDLFGFEREALSARSISPSWKIDLGALANLHSSLENTIGVVAAPIISEDHLYVVSGNEPSNLAEHGVVACFQLKDTPALVWSVDMADRCAGSVASPLIYKSSLVVATGFGELLVIDSATGSVNNRTDLDAVVYASPIVVNESLVVIDGDGRLLFLSLGREIEILRELRFDNWASSTPLLFGNRIIAAFRGELVAIRVSESNGGG